MKTKGEPEMKANSPAKMKLLTNIKATQRRWLKRCAHSPCGRKSAADLRIGRRQRFGKAEPGGEQQRRTEDAEGEEDRRPTPPFD